MYARATRSAHELLAVGRTLQCAARGVNMTSGPALTPPPLPPPVMMSAWVCEAYKTPLVCRQVRTPKIAAANQLLVKVHASSVNAIDKMMCEGYGHEALTALQLAERVAPSQLLPNLGEVGRVASEAVKKLTGTVKQTTRIDVDDPHVATMPDASAPRPPPPSSQTLVPPATPPPFGDTHAVAGVDGPTAAQRRRLPLIPGRDFYGQVVAVGDDVRNVALGDMVIGMVPSSWPGAHAAYTLTAADCVAKAPLDYAAVEVASTIFTSATAWSAFHEAGVTPENAHKMRALIHGGAGGVGKCALQLLRAWNVEHLVATALAKDLGTLRQLGAAAVNAEAADAREQLTREAPFDLILDCVKSELAEWSDKLLRTGSAALHVSLQSPVINNTDRYGLALGTLISGGQLLQRNLGLVTKGRGYVYGFAYPSSHAMEELARLLNTGQLKPILDKTYAFDDLPKAYAEMKDVGKCVINATRLRAQEAMPTASY